MGKRKAAEISEEKPDLGREFENSDWEQDVEELDGAARKCGGGRGSGRGGGKTNHSPAKPQRASESGRSKRRAGQGSKYCRGCKKQLPITDFAVNQDLHFGCKSVRDALYKMAKRQKQEEWFQSVLYDDEKLALLITRFMEVTKGHPAPPQEEQVRHRGPPEKVRVRRRDPQGQPGADDGRAGLHRPHDGA